MMGGRRGPDAIVVEVRRYRFSSERTPVPQGDSRVEGNNGGDATFLSDLSPIPITPHPTTPAIETQMGESATLPESACIDPLAYEYYLRGVDLHGQHSFPLAIKMLEKSTEIDPNYASAWAYLGASYTVAALSVMVS